MTVARILPGNEHIVAAILAKLQAGFNDTADAVNELNDGGPVIEQVLDSQIVDYVPTREELVNFPTIGLMEEEGTIDDDVGWGASGAHGFVIVVWDSHPDQRELARRLRRLRRIIASVLWDGRAIVGNTPIGGAWGIRDLRYQAGPTLGRRQNPEVWLSYTAIGFLALSEEDGV